MLTTLRIPSAYFLYFLLLIVLRQKKNQNVFGHKQIRHEREVGHAYSLRAAYNPSVFEPHSSTQGRRSWVLSQPCMHQDIKKLSICLVKIFVQFFTFPLSAKI